MASGEQLKALLRSFADNDEENFYNIAMQLAAREAKQGHGKLALELRSLIDRAKAHRQTFLSTGKLIPITQPRGELTSLISVSYPKIKMTDMVLDTNTYEKLLSVVKEQRQLIKIRSYGLLPRRKLLFIGPPGTGKTMSASALACELGLPLFIVKLDGLITKYMGETSAKLRILFDAIAQTRGIYLFDEFDSIGTHRSSINDVGEIKRVLNSFLQFIEQDDSDGLILAVTNQPEILDYALFRRFDDIIEYCLPSKKLIVKLIKNRLSLYKQFNLDLNKLADISIGLSYADITRACDEAAKDMFINNREEIRNEDIIRTLNERKAIKDKCFYKKT